MIAKELKLKNFRNYKEQTVSLCDGVNVFHGKNAQGKTNILEAVRLFSGIKSHRGAKDNELINFDSEECDISLSFDSHDREFMSEIKMERGKKRKIKVNGVGKKSLSSLAEFFTVVMFTPEDLSVIKGGPGERRRLLDEAISSVKPAYPAILSQYNKILENKNKLLKEEIPDKEMILLWNESLCTAGARIICYRKSFLKVLKPVLKKFHGRITDGEEIDFIYKTSSDEAEKEAEIRSVLLEKTTKGIDKEIISGMSLYGPHRDDIEFFINGRELKLFGSQGQQRTVVLGIKLSQIEIVKCETGEYPVLLLDDILSELDFNRRKFLLERIENHQVLITCTESDELSENKNNKLFHVENGRIV